MKKAIFLAITIIFLCVMISGEDQEAFEFSETDIICKDLKITSKNLSVRGISVDTSILEALTKFGKSISDIKFSIKYSSHKLIIEPGFEILTDNKTVKTIIISRDFKDLKGNTKEFFNFQTGVKALYFLFMNLGEPIELKTKEPYPGGGVDYELIFSNGISFRFLYKKFDKHPTSTIKIHSKLPSHSKSINSTKDSKSISSSKDSSKSKTSGYKSKKRKLVATRCLGYTKKGNRCKRKTTHPSGYCWHHRK